MRTMRKRRDFFWIRTCRRVYDRAHNRFSFNISYSTAVTLTPRTTAVAEAFGLGVDENHTFTVLDAELKIKPTDIVYVTGDSGSGKSVLLRAIKQDLRDEAVDVADIQVDKDKPLIETVGKTVEEGLEVLAKVGLSDAFLFLRTFNELSDGQKYRYRIAKLIEMKARFLILDEFAATLDRDTAKIVAFNLQKLARQEGRCVIAATTHNDLLKDLHPDVHIHKRFGKEIEIKYTRKKTSGECSLVKQMYVEEGSMKDWNALAGFHYRSHRVPAPRKIFVLKRGWDEICGVIVYCYPPPCAAGRRLKLPKMAMQELNQKLSCISRIVVHPKYRSIGLGSKLVRETLSRAGTECVEMSAVMAKYNPFAEKAGMMKVAVQEPDREAEKVLEVLKKLGFDPELLSSSKRVTERLQRLSSTQMDELKHALSRFHRPWFRKNSSHGQLYDRAETYRKQMAEAGMEDLAALIKICGSLQQKKVYLFWRCP